MYRLCVGYVSVMYRLHVETDEERKRKKKCIFLGKNLVESGDFSTFAGESDLRQQNYRRFRGGGTTKIIEN